MANEFGETGGPQLTITDVTGVTKKDLCISPDGDLAVGGNIPKGLPEIFKAESLTESTTTSDIFQLKVNLQFTALAADYLVQWGCSAGGDDPNTSFEVKIVQDDTTEHDITQFAPAKKHNAAPVNYIKQSGSFVVTLTAGTVDFDMNFRSSVSGKEIAIKKAMISATRLT